MVCVRATVISGEGEIALENVLQWLPQQSNPVVNIREQKIFEDITHITIKVYFSTIFS